MNPVDIIPNFICLFIFYLFIYLFIWCVALHICGNVSASVRFPAVHIPCINTRFAIPLECYINYHIFIFSY